MIRYEWLQVWSARIYNLIQRFIFTRCYTISERNIHVSLELLEHSVADVHGILVQSICTYIKYFISIERRWGQARGFCVSTNVTSLILTQVAKQHNLKAPTKPDSPWYVHLNLPQCPHRMYPCICTWYIIWSEQTPDAVVDIDAKGEGCEVVCIVWIHNHIAVVGTPGKFITLSIADWDTGQLHLEVAADKK